MSYDLKLYRTNGKKGSLSKNEIDSIRNKFDIIIRYEKDNNIISFAIKNKNDNFDWLEEGFDFWYQDEGCYLVTVPYSVSEEAFNYFINLVKNLTNELNLKIIDNQSGKEFSEKDAKEIFDYTKNVANRVIKSPFLWQLFDLKVPAKSKYFIMYFLISTDPQAKKKMVLTYDFGKVYCSKVNEGESLKSVLDKEIPMLIGSGEYKFVKKIDGGIAQDKYGNNIPRFNLYIEIPYFNPKDRNLKYDFSWKELKK